MKNTAHFGFWFLIHACVLLAAPLFISADTMYRNLVDEFVSVQQTFGDHVGGVIIAGANKVYGVFRESGLEHLVSQGVHSDADLKEAGRVFSAPGVMLAKAGSSYLSSLMMQVYSVAMRVLIMLFWLLLLIPLLAAAVLDGLSARKVKFASFGYQNPAAFALGSHALILLGVLPMLYTVLPLPISPLFMPAWALGACLPMAFAISHMQPIFTR